MKLIVTGAIITIALALPLAASAQSGAAATPMPGKASCVQDRVWPVRHHGNQRDSEAPQGDLRSLRWHRHPGDGCDCLVP